ncbi:MAG: ferrous iron transporter B, partial [Eubacteriales bacterium]|nr:ferrous iron transporter B [Eubacteriales bacterium]
PKQPHAKQLYQNQSYPRQIDSKGQYLVVYPEPVEKAIERIMPILLRKCKDVKFSRWLCLKLLEQDETLIREVSAYLGENLLQDESLNKELLAAQEFLAQCNIGADDLKDLIVSELVNSAEKICRDAVIYPDKNYNNFDFRLDRILTSKSTGYPVMLLLLAFIFWLTIAGANYPSRLLADGLFWIQDRLTDFFTYLHAPSWLHGVLVLGVYRVLAWVVSVMLPPMAIFFPLFTLLEDAGYLPRIAYNLDKPFKCCCACGKQALTMCIECVYLQSILKGFLCVLLL